MAGQDERKIVLVTRETRLDELIARFNTLGQAQFYVEHLGADFGDYLAEHGRYGAAIDACEAALGAFGRVQRLPRRYLANFLFAASDIVVAVGPDGLVELHQSPTQQSHVICYRQFMLFVSILGTY